MLWFSYDYFCLNVNRSERNHYLQGLKRGDYSIVYIAPEQVYSAGLRNALQEREIGLIAIDEAHCISQWGHDFRPAYSRLKAWIYTSFCAGSKRTFPLLALTATARLGHQETPELDTVKDIIQKLGLKLSARDIKPTSPERPELEFRVELIGVPCPECGCQSYGKGEVRCENKECQRRFSIGEEIIRQQKVSKLRDLLLSTKTDGLRHCWDQEIQKRQRGIIYCRTIRGVEKLCDDIHEMFPSLQVDIYHGGEELPDGYRKRVYQRFMSDGNDRLDIVIATNAFGMGIDARRLGFVIHFDVPATLEAYCQEAGRAGRDKEFTPKWCIL